MKLKLKLPQVLCMVFFSLFILLVVQNCRCKIPSSNDSKLEHFRWGGGWYQRWLERREKEKQKRALKHKSRLLTRDWDTAKNNKYDVKRLLTRFSLPASSDEYKNYCTLREYVGNCKQGRNDCRDECKKPGWG